MFVSLRRCTALLCLVLLPTAYVLPIQANSLVSSPTRAVLAELPPAHTAVGPADLPLDWVTYLGGTGNDAGLGTVVDDKGNLYVTGRTDSRDFPVTPGAAQPHFGDGGYDAFVAAYSPNGRLKWATYLGGTNDDRGYAIAVDGQGNVYVTGVTASTNFPHTDGSDYAGGNGDAFVTSYSSTGHLRWTTLLGGKGYDEGGAIAVDHQGNVYITGTTDSADLPVTSDAAQPRFGGGENDDAFVAAYSSTGRRRWTTYLGGVGSDDGFALLLEPQGNIYVIGSTDYSAFFSTPEALRPPYNPMADTYKDFSATYGSEGQLRQAGILHGPAGNGNAYALDDQGNLYVTGVTDSSHFPVTSGAAQSHYAGGNADFNGGDQYSDENYGDAFVAAYDKNLHLRWATYLGGKADDAGYGLAVDGQGNVYVTGVTKSADFPVTADAVQAHYAGGDYDYGDAFVTVYTKTGRLRWSSYLGGRANDIGFGIAVAGRGALYVTGLTHSLGFPLSTGGAQTKYRTDGDAFTAHLVIPARRPSALNPIGPSSNTVARRYFPTTRHTAAGPFLAFWTRLGGTSTLGLPLSQPFLLGGRQVQVTERAVLVLSGSRVQLLPLGRLLSAGRHFTPAKPATNTAVRRYFPATRHTLSGPFLTYWQAHQGGTLLGAPIGEPKTEGLGDGTGRTYLVQWFANGRLELHPELKDPRARVEQGRVGCEYLHRLGLL